MNRAGGGCSRERSGRAADPTPPSFTWKPGSRVHFVQQNKTSMCARGRRGPILFHKPSDGSMTPPPTPLQVYSPPSLDGRRWAGRSAPTELPENGRVRSRTSRRGPPETRQAKKNRKPGGGGGACEAYLLAGIQHLRGGRRSPLGPAQPTRVPRRGEGPAELAGGPP